MTTRRQQSYALRKAAAKHAYDRAHPTHQANGDERADLGYAFNFTKGLRHNHLTGLVDVPMDYTKFVATIHSGDPLDFRNLTPGYDPGDRAQGWEVPGARHAWRAWESQSAGLAFDLEGPDAQAVTMPPAPAALSAETTGEMAEVYAQALLRDVPLSELRHGGGMPVVTNVIADLNNTTWFTQNPGDTNGRHRGPMTRQTAFRGIAAGDDVGPYLSQFLLVGSRGLGDFRQITSGQLQYGAQTIDQRVQVATPGKDYLTSWNEWFDVQNGADTRGTETYRKKRRLITTGRDLATYVHYDALYQAYLNACLIMLDRGVRFDPGIPFQLPDLVDKQQGFAHFGPPHILSLVTEVATRALKAVRYQKFNIHRRARPEVMAARYEKSPSLTNPGLVAARNEIAGSGIGTQIAALNSASSGRPSFLLPMAFPEGSPMHPSYGAGHATVAGACVTILKAFFDVSGPFDPMQNRSAFTTSPSGALTSVPSVDAAGNPAELTIEGELNKLAANISIGRDWAGVHYFSDYWESLKMGEEIAIGLLEEQRLCYRENVTMTVPLFAGGSVTI